MIEELIKDINELTKYKNMYECAMKDKEKMSEMLLYYMNKEYENQSYESRCLLHKKDLCGGCLHNDYCTKELPQDVLKPIPSGKAWIPSKKICEAFKWS